MPENNAAELGALHVRIIALENLVISLLAAASGEQLEQPGEMARYITPRPGFTHHPLTTHAAAHLAPGEEADARAGIGAARVRVANVGGEELDVAPAGGIAGTI